MQATHVADPERRSIDQEAGVPRVVWRVHSRDFHFSGSQSRPIPGFHACSGSPGSRTLAGFHDGHLGWDMPESTGAGFDLMIMRASRFGKGTDSKQRALGSLGISSRAQILNAADSSTLRVLVLLGLIDGLEIRVESRDFRGDVTIETEGRRMRIPARFAQRIWVKPLLG